jgi:hypothetical protein
MAKATKAPKAMKPMKAMKAMKARARCKKWCSSGRHPGGGCCGDERCKRQCVFRAKHPSPTDHMCQFALEWVAEGNGGELPSYISKAL